MKKIYLIPSTKVINVKFQPLMNVSGGDASSVNSVTVSDTEDYGGGEILSRGSFWDDDEE